MSPVLPCPYCRKPYDFHEDELDGVADGSSVCLDCGMETAMNGWVMDVLTGEVDLSHLREEEEGEDE